MRTDWLAARGRRVVLDEEANAAIGGVLALPDQQAAAQAWILCMPRLLGCAGCGAGPHVLGLDGDTQPNPHTPIFPMIADGAPRSACSGAPWARLGPLHFT
jgi:hypothetical protein